MRGENIVAHLDGLGGTPVCRGKPDAHHCFMESDDSAHKNPEPDEFIQRLTSYLLLIRFSTVEPR
jgi:hypothetical protein